MLNEAICATAEAMLEKYGFVDKTGEHSWNMINMEHEVPSGTLIVWGREWSDLIFQWSQGYEETLLILETLDIAILEKAVQATVSFLDTIAAMQLAKLESA